VADREPCVRCGDGVPLDARECPYCDASALVDLLVDEPVTDGRKRFRLARAVSALGVGSLPSAEIQQALLKKDGVVARAVTRAFAIRAYQALEAEGVGSSLVHSSMLSRASGRSVPWKPIALGLVLVAVAALGVLNWRRLGTASPAATAPSPAATATPLPADIPRATSLGTKELAARCLPSTVSIRCPGSIGSGFFVTDELVLTNEHVVCPGGGPIEVVRSDGQKQTGVAIQSDKALDLALIRVAGAGAVPLPFGDVADLVVGEQVMVIGSPVGLEFTVHPGIVSNRARTFLGLSYVQIDAKVNPGNSGGPVLNDRGQVVAVVSLKHMGAEGIGLALPINYAWSGSSPLVPAPAAGNSSAFASMKAKADEENREMREAVARAEALPALLGGQMDAYGRLAVRIGRMANAPPAFETVTLKLTRGGEEVCTLLGDVSEWKAQPAKAVLEPRLESWMESNQLDRTVFVGEAPLRIDQCPREKMRGGGLVLELMGANPLVARAAVH
jgi:serine protease Do